MPYSDEAMHRASARGSMQRLRTRRAARGATGITLMLSDSDPTCDVTTVAGCQTLLVEAVRAARDPSLDAAMRSRLLMGIAAAGARIVADGAMEKRVAEIERVTGVAV